MEPGISISLAKPRNLKDPHNYHNSTDSCFSDIGMDSPIIPPAPNTSLPDLPNEILYQILKPLLPVLDRNPQPNRISYLHNQSMASGGTYQLRLKFFANYRLICSAMDPFVSSLLFEEFLLVLTPTTQLEPINTIFTHLAHLMHSVSVEVLTPLGDAAEAASLVIWRGIGRCLNLRKLECHGYHPLFTCVGWVKNSHSFGNFPNGITSVSITPMEPVQFAALACIGSTLKSLRLYDGCVPALDALNIPAPFPQLEEMTVERRSRLSWGHAVDLLTHVGPYDPTRQACRSSLRTLNIIRLAVSKENIRDLLHTNEIGVHLRTFRWVHCLRWSGAPYDAQQPVGALLGACPNLEELYLGCPGFPRSFGWIPPSLQHLTVFVPIEHISTIPWLISYIDWIQCQKCRTLRSITSLSIPLVPESVTHELKERCREVGARADIVYDPWMNTDGIKVSFAE